MHLLGIPPQAEDLDWTDLIGADPVGAADRRDRGSAGVVHDVAPAFVLGAPGELDPEAPVGADQQALIEGKSLGETGVFLILPPFCLDLLWCPLPLQPGQVFADSLGPVRLGHRLRRCRTPDDPDQPAVFLVDPDPHQLVAPCEYLAPSCPRPRLSPGVVAAA